MSALHHIYYDKYDIWKIAFAFHDLNAHRFTVTIQISNFSNKEVGLGLKVTS